MSKNSYAATFSNGQTITRKSPRIYTHAWLVTYTNTAPGSPWEGKTYTSKGFSGSEPLAHKALGVYRAPHLTLHFIEVQPVQIATR